jgi:hypothetical protein
LIITAPLPFLLVLALFLCFFYSGGIEILGGGSDATKLPISTKSGRDDLFALGRLCAYFCSDGVTFDDLVAQSAKSLNLDLDYITDLDWP